MRSYVYLVVISLTFGFLAGALDTLSLESPSRESKYSPLSTRSDFARKFKRPGAVKINRPAIGNTSGTRNKIAATKSVTKGSKVNTKLVKGSRNVTTKTNKLAFIDLSVNSKTDLESRDKRRRHKKRMNQAMMALLMAYKIKFAALIPSIIGGKILLIATTALAGFFFALFAAVLGLKAH